MVPTEGTPFVVFGDDWDRHPSTIQHTFRHIATRYPVIWVNGIGHAVPRLSARHVKRAFEKLGHILRADAAQAPAPHAVLGGGVPASIIYPRVLPWHNIGFVHASNTKWLVRAIKERLASLGLTKPPILVTGSPPSDGVVGRLGELASVYYVLDDFLAFPSYTASMLGPLEKALLDKIDMVVGTAASLTKTKFPRSGRAYHLPQGVNYQHFAEPRPLPADLAGLPRPLIGFAGGLARACDLPLLGRIADAFPDASIVLIGPNALDESELAQFRRPNVHMLGSRPYIDLPGYVQHFDVGIIPYAISQWTVAVDPLKLLEYLAAGLPVVTTAIPEAQKYASHVTVAPTHEDFIKGIRDALTVDRAAARARGQGLAREHTWERRADAFLALVGDVLAQKGVLQPAAKRA
jgi:glycosyltransferase involved in cell wall biosynthesis